MAGIFRTASDPSGKGAPAAKVSHRGLRDAPSAQWRRGLGSGPFSSVYKPSGSRGDQRKGLGVAAVEIPELTVAVGRRGLHVEILRERRLRARV